MSVMVLARYAGRVATGARSARERRREKIMRNVQPEAFEVFQLDELEPAAREKAIATVAEKMVGDWWDQHDIDMVSASVLHAVASKLGTPGVQDYGDEDFPGIQGAYLRGWDAGRGGCVEMRGVLNRENAPALPWAAGLVEVALTDGRGYTAIVVETDDEDLDPDMERDVTTVRNELDELAETMRQAVEEALAAGVSAAREVLEYVGSEENAVRYIEDGEREFHADGTLYF